jgi:hypothetical protein
MMRAVPLERACRQNWYDYCGPLAEPKKQLSIMWLIIATVLVAVAIVGIMVLKAMGRSVMNKPTWKGGIISGLLGLLPFYLLLCLFGFMGIEREEEF